MNNKDAYYFKHDSNARNDEKLLAVRRKLGMEGYGIYWAIIEKLREANEYSMSSQYDDIAWDLRVREEKVRSVIEDFELFVFADGKFTSERLLSDMHEWNKKKKAMSDGGKSAMEKRWSQSAETTTVPQNPADIPTCPPAPNPTSDSKKGKPGRKKYSAEETALHSKCKESFSELYQRYKGADYYWQAKDMAAVVGILKQIRFQMPEDEKDNLDLVAYNFQIFTQAVMTRADDWVRKNVTPSLINSKFNEIYTQLKNSTRNGNKPSASATGNARDDREYIATLIADLQSGGNK